MKCQMTAEGVLHLIPENEVEQFALSKWDRTQVVIDPRDYWACSIKASQDFLELIQGERAAFEEFKRQRDSQVPTDERR